MKTRIFLGILITLLVTCSKSPTDSSGVNYTLSDIVGTWIGQAQSSSNNFTLNLTIDSEGNASGTGAEGDIKISSSEWNIDNEGTVTGNNVISIHSAGMLTVQWCNWSLHLSQDKVTLSGELSSNALGTMDVNLARE